MYLPGMCVGVAYVLSLLGYAIAEIPLVRHGGYFWARKLGNEIHSVPNNMRSMNG
jgi:hypothetical protein